MAKPAPAAWLSRSKSSPPPNRLLRGAGPLTGRRVIITSGPTSEPIDPVRFIANRSSGKQGHAIAAAAADAGAEVVLDQRPGQPARSARRERHQDRDRAADARCGRKGAAGRYRDLRRRGRRLAHRTAEPQQDQEAAGRDADAQARREPRYSLDDRASQNRPAAARHRLCGRDRRRDRQCAGQARQEGLRLDSRQRCLAGDRHHGRRHQYDSSDLAARRRRLAAAIEGRCRAYAGRAASLRNSAQTAPSDKDGKR